MSLGKYESVIEQLGHQPELADRDVANAVVIILTKLGADGVFTFDFVNKGKMEEGARMTMAVESLVATLLRSEGAPLVILCPMDAEGNEPSDGETWDFSTHLKACEMACLAVTMMVCRHRDTKKIIANEPRHTFLVGTIKDGTVMELGGAAGRIRAQIKESMES